MDVQMRGRLNTATVMKKLGVKGAQVALAVSMNTSEASISRLKNDGNIEQVCVLLAHAGLKVVEQSAICFSEEYINALLTLARAQMKAVKTVDQLKWEDTEAGE